MCEQTILLGSGNLNREAGLAAMEELREQFLQSLREDRLDAIASYWILERIPHVFAGNLKAYIDWKFRLSRPLEVDNSAVLLVGSAAAGISLNPNKNFKPFDVNSDIDVAIVSDHFFRIGWHALVNLRSKRYSLSPAAQQVISDHRERLIYWGTLATDRITQIFPFGKKLQEAISPLSRVKPTDGRSIKVRIYRDHESLRAYQINCLAELRDSTLGAK